MRTSLDRHEIRQQTGSNGPHGVLEEKHPSVDRGGRTQSLYGFESIVDEKLELEDVVTVGKDSRVATGTNQHPRRHRRLKAGSLVPQKRGFRIHALAPATILGDRVAGSSVGHKATPRPAISRKTSGVPPSPCSIVLTPASTARPIPSALDACATVGRPELAAVSTIVSSSSME